MILILITIGANYYFSDLRLTVVVSLRHVYGLPTQEMMLGYAENSLL